MKSTKLYNWLFFSFLFASTCLISSCKQENAATPDISSTKADGEISAVTDKCTTCSYENLYKTVGNNNEVIGTVSVCRTASDLKITFAVSGTDAWFNQTGYGIYLAPPPALNPSPTTLDSKDHVDGKLRTYTYTVALSSLGDPLTLIGTTVYVACYAVVPGPDGAGGMVWAGSLKPAGKNPNSRYFSYTIRECETPEPPTAGCFFSQGYWFAKPNGSQWLPLTQMVFGGHPYTYSQARAIFFSSNAKTGKTDAKQAFLQGLAYKLSRHGGADGAGVSACNGADDALLRIEAYFNAIPVKQSTATINTYGVNASLRADASLLSSCISAHHCNSIGDDAALK